MSSSGSQPDLDRLGGQVLREVLGSWLGLAAEPGREASHEAQAGLLASVPLTGERISGTVRIHLTQPFAEQVCVRLMGGNHRGPVGHADLADFAGELCNILAGRVVAQLRSEGYASALGTPDVVGGRHLPDPSEPEPNTQSSRTNWSCQGHRLQLEMRFRYRPT